MARLSRLAWLIVLFVELLLRSTKGYVQPCSRLLTSSARIGINGFHCFYIEQDKVSPPPMAANLPCSSGKHASLPDVVVTGGIRGL